MDYFHLKISTKNKDQIKPDFSQQKAHAPQILSLHIVNMGHAYSNICHG